MGRCRLAWLWPLVAVLAACGPPAPAPAPVSAPPPAPAAAPAPATAPAAAANNAPPPPAVAEPATPAASAPLADPERNAVVFEHWRSKHRDQVHAFEEFLVHEHVAQVVPTYQLLRSASMWKECHADPFELPPDTQWPRVTGVLELMRTLRDRGVLPRFEVVSAYRDPRLNRCAGGAPGSAHQRFAVDIAPLTREEGTRLCRFWREEGKAWNMGVSRYASGRIHIDRDGYRTWGGNYHRGSSYCLR